MCHTEPHDHPSAYPLVCRRRRTRSGARRGLRSPSLRPARLLLALALLLAGSCYRPAPPNLRITDGPPLPVPVPIFLGPERDLDGAYFERLAFFDIVPLRDHLVSALARDSIRIETRLTYHSSPTLTVIPNFFMVTDDSAAADLILDVGVEHFAYESPAVNAAKLREFWILGGLALTDEKPKGIVAATCRVRPARSDGPLSAASFDIVGVSGAHLPKEEALEAAMKDAERAFLLQLFEFDGMARAKQVRLLD